MPSRSELYGNAVPVLGAGIAVLSSLSINRLVGYEVPADNHMEVAGVSQPATQRLGKLSLGECLKDSLLAANCGDNHLPGPDRVHIASVSQPVPAPVPTTIERIPAILPSPSSTTTSTTAPPPTTTTTTAPESTTTTVSNGGGSDLGTFEITCYDLRGHTANGDEAGPESAAVDPSVIPLGSHIWISGIGNRVADDTGSAVKGRHIDIWESSYQACAQWGRQYRDVHRLS